MHDFLMIGTIGTLLIILTCFIAYEIMRVLWVKLPQLTIPPRYRVLIVLGAVFLIHIVSIWIYGIAFYMLNQYEIAGRFFITVQNVDTNVDFFFCLYFSAVAYTSLGLGDVIPHGGLRFLTGVATLNGLVLIGWTVSFLYLCMEKFWALPHGRK